MQGNSKRKVWVFRAVSLALPIVLVLLAEYGLRLGGVLDERRAVFAEIEQQPGYVVLNPGFVQGYFQSFSPSIAFNPLEKEKANGTFRVVVMGGSSTAGFPYHFGHAFPAQLQSQLESYAIGQKIEVANIGLTAVNSYTLWDVKAAVADLEPDAILIYAGHNEYYGALGVGSSIGSFGNKVWLKRLVLKLRHSVLYLLLEDLLTKDAPPASPDSRTLMARVVRDATIDRDGEIFRAGVTQFESNLGSTLKFFQRKGIDVFIGTLASNLAGQAPLGDNAAAVKTFSDARLLSDNGDHANARTAFLEAKEIDDIRFRAPEALNRSIRKLANEFNARVVETQQAIVAESANGIEGDDLFTDHLHPNHRGYSIVARAFYDVLKNHTALRPNQILHHPISEDALEAAYARIRIARLTGGYPFDKKITPEQEDLRYRRLLESRLRAGYADSLAVVELTNQSGPSSTLLQAVNIARAKADTLEALKLYRSLLSWQPFNDGLMETAVNYALASEKFDQQTIELSKFAANRNGELFHYNALGAALLRSQDIEGARAVLNFAETLDGNSSVMLYNQARLQLALGDTLRAQKYFERYQAANND